ncbi:hypothetical protein OH77DRAFT_1443988 [Trametes cingulata]|nr:hypothetical protein OH77DRAFT_1443988 [Trametes cingulata]
MSHRLCLPRATTSKTPLPSPEPDVLRSSLRAPPRAVRKPLTPPPREPRPRARAWRSRPPASDAWRDAGRGTTQLASPVLDGRGRTGTRGGTSSVLCTV